MVLDSLLVELETGVPIDIQDLYKDNEEAKENSKAASDYGITKGSLLEFFPKKIIVSVEIPDGSAHNVEISTKDTCAGIKDHISKKTGFEPKQQVVKLIFKEVPDDGTTMFTNVSIQDGSN